MAGRFITIGTMSLRTVPMRPASSIVIVAGIAGVVAVFIGLLALANGFEAAMESTARPDRALVLTSGSTREIASYFTGNAVGEIANMEGVAIASGELLMQEQLRNRESKAVEVVIRAIDQQGLALRPEIALVRGRLFEPGKDEVIVGRALLDEIPDLDIGDTVPYQNGELEIVGHFAAAGTVTESEILMDLISGRSAYRRGNAVNAVRVRLTGPEMISDVGARLEQDPAKHLWILSEAEVLAEPTARRRGLFETFAYWIVGIMSVGGLAAALTTMHAAIDQRMVEIGTLRALGFGPTAILTSIVLEALVLAAAGAAVGGLAVVLLFHEGATATTNPISGTMIAFSFTPTGPLLQLGIALGIGLGVLSGILATIRALRIPIPRAVAGVDSA